MGVHRTRLDRSLLARKVSLRTCCLDSCSESKSALQGVKGDRKRLLPVRATKRQKTTTMPREPKARSKSGQQAEAFFRSTYLMELARGSSFIASTLTPV